MRKLVVFSLVLLIAFVLLLIRFHRNVINTPNVTIKEQPKKASMNIKSSAFEHNQTVPSKYTCDGENISPPLAFSDVPQNAKSLILVVDDPDAPSKTWVHWIVFNISPNIKELAENSVPEGGTQGTTDFGKPGYGGPCPPSGVHHYFFKLYALDTTLNLLQNATKKEVEEHMNGHIVTSSELIGLYKRR